jgi:hypothetical protein
LALALSRYVDREGFYAGQPKQELGAHMQRKDWDAWIMGIPGQGDSDFEVIPIKIPKLI